ncbi:DEAD/DEAH box helicase family protein [Sphaerisporangium sp. NPDC049003]|uniref:DEAD/DEAH box helicase family protein n=1 Tax=Sphaerisporangium sp. NPDC049003 TaxID=3364517 RepID=UPI003722E214
MGLGVPGRRSKQCDIGGNVAWRLVASDGADEDVDHGQVLASFDEAFRFRQEDPERGVVGLREPQLGAVYAVLGHWASRRSQPATVVMPTGTGKTETMVALLVAGRVERLLVIVPSDALRDQIAIKFERLGLLKGLGVVAGSA